MAAVQEDNVTTGTSCTESWELFETTMTNVQTITADKTDFTAGLQAKGNGYANDVGFYLYSFLKWSDVIIVAADIYTECSIDYYMLASGTTLTSVQGVLNTGTSLLWRIFGTDDVENWTEMSNAVTNNDPVSAGNAFGVFFKKLWMEEVPGTAEIPDYTPVVI